MQFNTVVVGMTYVMSHKTDSRNSRREPTRFSCFHFQQNGCSSDEMALEDKDVVPILSSCPSTGTITPTKHTQLHELVLKEETESDDVFFVTHFPENDIDVRNWEEESKRND